MIRFAGQTQTLNSQAKPKLTKQENLLKIRVYLFNIAYRVSTKEQYIKE